MIAAGGSGGAGNGSGYESGGGGAGGLWVIERYEVQEKDYTVTVGNGVSNANGENSSFDGIIVYGGGKGGSYSAGNAGGSGGGGSHPMTAGGGAQPYTQGNTGAQPDANSKGGGGGGAGAVGGRTGIGGNGLNLNITGTKTWYAGGGGAYPSYTAGLGGGGGGGSVAGTANTGGGGGGAYSSSSAVLGGLGGSGLIVIRYKTNDFGVCSGGTITYDGEYTVHSFLSSDTFSVKLKRVLGHTRQRYDLSGVTTPNKKLFSPTNVPYRCQLWMDASQISGLNDGDVVSTWYDQSGANRDLSQPTAAYKPIYKTNIINGLPVVRFDGSNDTMLAANSGVLNLTGPMEFFVVHRPMATGAVLFHKEAQYSVQEDASYNLAWADSSNYSYANFGYHAIGLAYNTWSILNIYKASDFTVWMWRDGVAQYAAGFGGAITGTANTFCLGSYNGTSAFLNGDIAEVLIFDMNLTIQTRQLIWTYLKTKYGL